MRALLVLFASALALVACDRPQPASVSADPNAPSASSPASTTMKPKGKWACAVDDECTNSCRAGAVSKAWYAAADVKECNDGCANQLSAPPRCIDGACVAFRRNPKDASDVTRDDECTHRP